MKLKFEANLEYQKNAIKSTIDLLKGQKIEDDALFSVPGNRIINEGVGNNLELTNKEILNNLQNIQVNNGLAQSTSLTKLEFDIEMETGTGKTYVYLKTILEMNKQYGFKKFIIIVPSIAIKEGVFKNLEITKEHFKNLYDNVNYNFYIYKSKDLNQIHSFSTNNHISIMVINIDSFNKKEINKIHQNSEDLNGSKPIDLIKETNPIIIIDEPQSLSTNKSKEAIDELSPAMVLKYSATHKKISNLIYKLDPIDAFNQKLVKRIEVISIIEKISSLKLISTKSDQNGISAAIQIECQTQNGLKNKEIIVKKNDDLYELSGYLDKYKGYIIEEINSNPENEFISFTLAGFVLTRNSNMGGDKFQDEIKRLQISSTIEEHFKKQLKLQKYGVKVLSLFFIDKVSNYREYEDGGFSIGKYAKMFEEEFIKVGNQKRFRSLFQNKNIELLAKTVHNGYFSKDTKGIMKDTNGNTKDDASTYELIMKDKEKLLSFKEDLSFIFSHSALREGWDNPNVFQICTLNESKSLMKKRQEIGRGLRLCVNQEGERQYEDSFNILTIIANEGYETFAKQLQKDYQDEGIQFNKINRHSFALINQDGKPIGVEKSNNVFDFLYSTEYIDKSGNLSVNFTKDQNLTKIDIPSDFEILKHEIINILQQFAKELPIQNASKKRKLKINKEIFLNKDFKLLWDKVKYKTSYSIDFNIENLKSEIIKKINLINVISDNNMLQLAARIKINKSGVFEEEFSRNLKQINYTKINYPDIVSKIQQNTNLTRKTIVDILKQVNNFEKFKMNPQSYIDQSSSIIKFEMQKQMVDGIKYTKIGDDYFYEQTLFEDKEIAGYLEKNMLQSKKNIFDHVIYDSNIEKTWAEKMESNKDIILYTKLPSWFKIGTPLGAYNPDWAILINNEVKKTKLYFVVETKGNIIEESLRSTESQKIRCSKAHFKAINNNTKFDVCDNFNSFIEKNLND